MEYQELYANGTGPVPCIDWCDDGGVLEYPGPCTTQPPTTPRLTTTTAATTTTAKTTSTTISWTEQGFTDNFFDSSGRTFQSVDP